MGDIAMYKFNNYVSTGYYWDIAYYCYRRAEIAEMDKQEKK